MLFESTVIIGGGSIVALAVLEKLAEDYGYSWLGGTIKLLVPIAGLAVAVYFLEFNPLLHWLRL
jgi:hypothetical protein